MDSEKHDKIAREYAEKRKKRADFYYRILFSSCFMILFLFLDVVSNILPSPIRLFSLLILIPFSYVLYKKWRYLSTKKIITAELPTGEILVGSENIRFRIGGNKLVDKIRNFFEEM